MGMKSERKVHMRGNILTAVIIFFVCGLIITTTDAQCGEVKVMIGIALADRGERARLLTVAEFNSTRPDYEEFRTLLEKAPTLKDTAKAGWSIVHVEAIRDGYHLFILER